MSAVFPCKKCGMSHLNSVHRNRQQFDYHPFEEPEEIDDDEITREKLLNVLTRYEGAIQEANDDSSEAVVLELADAREALMDLLLAVKENIR